MYAEKISDASLLSQPRLPFFCSAGCLTKKLLIGELSFGAQFFPLDNSSCCPKFLSHPTMISSIFMKQPQFGLDDVRDYVNSVSGLFKGKPNTRVGNRNIQDAIIQPGRLLGEVSGVADAYRAVQPNASAKDQAIGLLSVIGALSAQEAAAATGLAAAKAARDITDNSYMFGKTVVHGSPEVGLQMIDPRYGSAARPTQKVAYGWNPRAFGDKRLIENYAAEHAKGGSIYVGKALRGAILPEANKGVVVSEAPIKVMKEIDAFSGNVGDQIDRQIAGYAARKAKRAIDEKMRARAIKRTSRISPV